jgi:hypothetical protein
MNSTQRPANPENEAGPAIDLEPCEPETEQPAAPLIPRKRFWLCLLIAILADAADVAPGLAAAVDLATGLLLTALIGWRWQILAVLLPEIFPPTALFPSWVMLVLYLAKAEGSKPEPR